MLTAEDAREISVEHPVLTIGWETPIVNAIEKNIEFCARNGHRVAVVTAQMRLFLKLKDGFDVLLRTAEYEHLALVFRERGFETSEVKDWGFEIRW